MRGERISIYKRGRIYWYKFTWKQVLIRQSTKQANQHVARQMEAAHRSSLAKGEVGIRDKEVVPSLADFITSRVEPLLKASTSEKTWLDYYRPNLKTIHGYKPLANLKLSGITSERASDFASWRVSRSLQVSSVNSSLQVLRRILRLAAEWGLIEAAPRIKMLPGERHREHVVSAEEEERYLLSASESLAAVATVLIDTGLRPDECYRLRWEFISWSGGRNGTLLVTHGKTAAARRVLPMTPRVRRIFEKAVGAKRKAEPKLGLASTYEDGTLREIDPEEAAPASHSCKPRSPIRALQSAPYVSHASGAVWMRRMDSCQDRWP